MAAADDAADDADLHRGRLRVTKVVLAWTYMRLRRLRRNRYLQRGSYRSHERAAHRYCDDLADDDSHGRAWLSDDEFFVTGMLAQNISLRVNEVAFRAFVAAIVFQKPGVVVIGHETDFVAVFLLRHA